MQRVYKGLTSLLFGYKSFHVLQRIKFVIAFIVEGCHHFCQMMSGFRDPYLPKVTPACCHVFEGPSLFYLFCSGSSMKYPCQILFNSDDWFQGVC